MNQRRLVSLVAAVLGVAVLRVTAAELRPGGPYQVPGQYRDWIASALGLKSLLAAGAGQADQVQVVLAAAHGDDASQRWRDIPSNPYNTAVADSHNSATFYDGKPAVLTYHPTANTFAGSFSLTGLKPNFCYQMKLDGKPTWPLEPGSDPGDAASEALGYAGRWWLTKINKRTGAIVSAWNSTDAEYEYWKVRSFTDRSYYYFFKGYLVFDHVVTDGNGSAAGKFYLDSSFHVFFKSGQSMAWYCYPVGTYTIDPGVLATDTNGVPWYATDYEASGITIYGEIEHEDQWYNDEPHETVLPDGPYPVAFLLAEESFHESNIPEGGSWAGVMQGDVTFTIDHTKPAPVAFDDSAEAVAGVPAVIDVLTNDVEADSVVSVSAPAHGSAVVNADGRTITYTAAGSFFGTDRFTYVAASAGGLQDSAAVTVAVAADGDPNAVPVAVDDTCTVAQDAALGVAAPGVLTNDYDLDGDPLTATLVSGPAHGALTLNPDGSFSYTPESGFSGEDGFAYRASDGAASSAAATVTITVTPAAGNRAPVALADVYVLPKRSNTVPAPGVLANDWDPDGDALRAVLVAGPKGGTLKLNADGSFTYKPRILGAPDSFSYQVTDGALVSEPVTVSINAR